MTRPDTPWSAPGLLRAVQAEAAHTERVRLLGLLRRRAEDAGLAAKPDARTASGRLATTMREVVEFLEAQSGELTDLTAGEPWTSIAGAVDGIEVYAYTADDDPLPVRVAVYDGAADTAAVAYLDLTQAADLHRDLGTLIERLRRQPTPDNAGDAP